jgi:hypothetical protein
VRLLQVWTRILDVTAPCPARGPETAVDCVDHFMQNKTHPPLPPRGAMPAGARRTPLLLAALVFFVSLLLTFGVYNSSHHLALSRLQDTFGYRARDMTTVLGRRMAVYEQVLRGAQGFLDGSAYVSRKDFADYFSVLKLEEQFPGIEALGVATILAPGQLEAHQQAVRREGFPGYAVHPLDPARPLHVDHPHRALPGPQPARLRLRHVQRTGAPRRDGSFG